MQLNELLNNIATISIIGDTSVAINTIKFDSREVEENDLFVAIKGDQADGHRYINQITEKAAAVVFDDTTALPPETERGQTVFIQVENSAATMGQMAANFYHHPSKKVKLVGITGTNGKTSTVTLLHKLFQELGYQVGLLSTIENKINDRILDTKFTTPDAMTINRLLSEMHKEGCQYCFMEVSSHALVQHRVTGLHFEGAIFSNISHDHLDYHKTFDEYIKAKKMFFDNLPKQSFALVNKDDRRWSIMLQNCNARHQTYALKSMADFKGKLIANTFEGLQMEVENTEAWFQLIGDFNAYNLLAVYATACLLGEDRQEALMALSALKPARGRFEQVTLQQNIRCVVDYAHTPDALKNVLETIQQIRETGERIITVVGCGGNRDKSKRPKMAQIASRMSEKVVFTSDNPRFEHPREILRDMEAGLDITEKIKTKTIENRKEAIVHALNIANPGDIILIAGKGHETYQEIEGVRHHFDDLQIVKEIGNVVG